MNEPSVDERTAVVVLGHPDPASFNHALAATMAQALREQAWRVEFRDLYAEGFDPVMPVGEVDTVAASALGVDPLVLEHQRLLAVADVLVVVHPNWWGKPPAMLAGWIDRVLAPGVAYRLRDHDGAPEALLRLRHLIVLNTSDTPAERESTVFGDPLQSIWQRCIGEYVPGAAFTRRTFGPVGTSSADERARWLQAAASLPAIPSRSAQ